MAHSYTNLLYHIVFATKIRQPFLDSDIRSRLLAYLGGAVRGEGGIALVVNGMPDHVHLLVCLRQDVALADVVRAVKANSSGWIHRTFPSAVGFAWQTGYAAFTVSHSQRGRVRQYIADQERHHRRYSFQEEWLGLMKAHGIVVGEINVWG
jgi:REP element-mobilizing transposase RayT